MCHLIVQRRLNFVAVPPLPDRSKGAKALQRWNKPVIVYRNTPDQVANMLTDTEAYRKPLKTATPLKKGQVVGARLVGQARGLPDTRWNMLPAGETRQISAGTVLHVKGPGKRLQSFWFDETGSVCGPMWFSTVETSGPEHVYAPPDLRQFLLAGAVATLGMLGVMALIKEPAAVLGDFAPAEVTVSLLLGWVLTLGWCIRCTRKQRRVRSKVLNVSPPRSSLGRDGQPLADQV